MIGFLTGRLGGWAAGALATMAALLWALWLRGELYEQARRLDSETMRANVATEAASQNAEKVLEVKRLMSEAQDRQKQRDSSHAELLAERDAEIARMVKMKEKWYAYLDGNQAVAARAWRADFNRLQRELAEATCRANCKGRDGKGPN